MIKSSDIWTNVYARTDEWLPLSVRYTRVSEACATEFGVDGISGVDCSKKLDSRAFIHSRLLYSANKLSLRSYILDPRLELKKVACPMSHIFKWNELMVDFGCSANPTRLWIQFVNKTLCQLVMVSYWCGKCFSYMSWVFCWNWIGHWHKIVIFNFWWPFTAFQGLHLSKWGWYVIILLSLVHMVCDSFQHAGSNSNMLFVHLDNQERNPMYHIWDMIKSPSWFEIQHLS